MYESVFSLKHVHLFQSEIVFFRIHELQHTSFSEHMKFNAHHQLSIFFSKTNQIVPTKKCLLVNIFIKTVAKQKIIIIRIIGKVM